MCSSKDHLTDTLVDLCPISNRLIWAKINWAYAMFDWRAWWFPNKMAAARKQDGRRVTRARNGSTCRFMGHTIWQCADIWSTLIVHGCTESMRSDATVHRLPASLNTHNQPIDKCVCVWINFIISCLYLLVILEPLCLGLQLGKIFLWHSPRILKVRICVQVWDREVQTLDYLQSPCKVSPDSKLAKFPKFEQHTYVLFNLA